MKQSIKFPRQTFDLVEIAWIDACDQEPGWKEKVGRAKPHLVRSAGYMLSKSNGHIVLAMDLDEGSLHNGRSQIPRGMVKQIKVLRKKDK